jgi:hypothetical protein
MKVNSMKSLVSAIALATAMAFAAPAMAQAPAAPDANTPAVSKNDDAKPDAAKPKVSKRMAHRPMRAIRVKHAALKGQRHGRMHAAHMRPLVRHASAGHFSRRPGDNVANQLNRQEMQRLSGGGMPEQGQFGGQPAYQGQ